MQRNTPVSCDFEPIRRMLVTRTVCEHRSGLSLAGAFKTIGVLTFALALFIPAIAGAETKEQRNWEEYPEDYGALREEIGWSDEWYARCDEDRPLQAMVESMRAGDWDEAVGTGRAWLEACPIDITFHYYMGISLSESEREAEGQVHFTWLDGLLNSILASGDGRTEDSPLVVISTSEEYDVLRVLGLRPVGQSLVFHEEVPLDQLDAESEAGDQFTIFFNPAAHFARLDKALGP